MMSTPLPNVEGLKLHGVLDDTWTKQHPQFVPALVWATQHAIWYRKQLRVSAPAQVRCAACLAVKSDEHTGGGHCSKCKQVIYARGFKEGVTEGEALLSLQVLLNKANAPGSGREARLRAAYANLWAARHIIDKGTPTQAFLDMSGLGHEEGLTAINLAWDDLQRAVEIGKELKVWSIQRDALELQVRHCRELDSTRLTTGMIDTCKTCFIQGGAHKDLLLQAWASHTHGGIMAQVQPQKGLELIQLSRELWSDLMKAAWVQAKGLTLGSPEGRVVQECATRLVQLLINMAGVHTTLGQPAESEKVLREALKYTGMVPDPLVEFDILLALSNNLELHEETRQGSQDLRNRAAIYREHLIVSMVKSGRDEPKECAVCLEELDAKQPSQLEKGLKPRIVVLPCCHVFHHGCAIRWNARNMNCPTCRTPLGQLYHG